MASLQSRYVSLRYTLHYYITIQRLIMTLAYTLRNQKGKVRRSKIASNRASAMNGTIANLTRFSIID